MGSGHTLAEWRQWQAWEDDFEHSVAAEADLNFHRIDRNHDGVISREEYRRAVREATAAANRDRVDRKTLIGSEIPPHYNPTYHIDRLPDNTVPPHEFRVAAREASTSRESFEVHYEHEDAALQKRHAGPLSVDRTVLLGSMHASQYNPTHHVRRHDGVILPHEMRQAAREASIDAAYDRRGGRGERASGDGHDSRADAAFDHMDRNRDGHISREELRQAKLDATANGACSGGGDGHALEVEKRCSCGNVLTADSHFCRKCGRQCREVEHRCPCGHAFLPDSHFCRKCGRHREARASYDQPAYEQEEPQWSEAWYDMPPAGIVLPKKRQEGWSPERWSTQRRRQDLSGRGGVSQALRSWDATNTWEGALMPHPRPYPQPSWRDAWGQTHAPPHLESVHDDRT